MSIAYLAGSFDPLTLGHVALLKQGLDLFDKIIIGIGVHHQKAALFSFEERAEIIRTTADEFQLDSSRISVESFDGLLVDAVQKAGANAILRGLRTASDFDYEIGMCDMNHTMAGDIHTLFLTAPAEYRNISSTLVRQIAKMGGDVSPFVPKYVLKALSAKLA